MKHITLITGIIIAGFMSNSLTAMDHKQCAYEPIAWGPHAGDLFPYEDDKKESKFICWEHAHIYKSHYVTACSKCSKYVDKSFAHKHDENGALACFSCAQQHEGFKQVCFGCGHKIASQFLVQKELRRKTSGKSPPVNRLYYLCTDCVHNY